MNVTILPFYKRDLQKLRTYLQPTRCARWEVYKHANLTELRLQLGTRAYTTALRHFLAHLEHRAEELYQRGIHDPTDHAELTCLLGHSRLELWLVERPEKPALLVSMNDQYPTCVGISTLAAMPEPETARTEQKLIPILRATRRLVTRPLRRNT